MYRTEATATLSRTENRRSAVPNVHITPSRTEKRPLLYGTGLLAAITSAAGRILSPVVAEGGEWCDGLFSRTNLLAFHKVALNRNDIVPGIQYERY